MSLRNDLIEGIPSYCTGNILVIRSLMRLYRKFPNRKLLIEATANQVNQFGGYTGKSPLDFKREVLHEAQLLGFSESKLIFGGDHLGPLVWQDSEPNEAMDRAVDLVREFANAGYQKIHLDTSMPLGEERGKFFSTKTIAERGLRLYKACEQSNTANDIAYIIGSEVPVPGGETSCNALSVTRPEDAMRTIEIYKTVFYEGGVSEQEFDEKICALVVQPGVEFTKDKVFYYKSEDAQELVGIDKSGLIFEGHSTDYQKASCLKEMVNDGIKILKVGPELTYMLRIALEKLEFIEEHVVSSKNRSFFTDALIEQMKLNSKYWVKYYSADSSEDFLCSYLDRSRYYLNTPVVLNAIEKMGENLRAPIDSCLLYKSLPEIEIQNRDNIFERVVDYYIGLVVEKYENAFS